jgi:glycosyltransferase involved in cell wall biosynthesis
MKSIHLSNIANVAYGYCKILNEGGYPVDLRCHDMKHLMSQPEWDDLELDPADFPDENNFYNNKANFNGYRRPEWYLNEELGNLEKTAPLMNKKIFQIIIHGLKKVLSRRTKDFLLPYFYTFIELTSPFQKDHVALIKSSKRYIERCKLLASESKKYGMAWTLHKSVLVRYLRYAQWLDRHLSDHDVIFAYVFSPVYAMLHGQKPYISVEIGTMRDVPFDETDVSKALWLAYKHSDHILITNPDNNIRAEEHGISNYSFCPHPLDEDLYIPLKAEQPLRKQLTEKYQSDIIMFAPARQNWKIKRNDKFIRAFAELVKTGVKAVLLIPGWGQEIERSKNLCNNLGIQDNVIWLAPVSEKLLIKYYQASDMILDQFELGVFGLITPKAMACGKPVLTSYDKALNEWCFKEHPPVVACKTEDEIYKAMHELSTMPSKRIEIGKRSRDWVLKHHSKKAIRDILLNTMNLAKENFERKIQKNLRKSAF